LVLAALSKIKVQSSFLQKMLMKLRLDSALTVAPKNRLKKWRTRLSRRCGSTMRRVLPSNLHLSDQLLLPLALATGASTFTVARPTGC
jgi:hypothetical protein